MASGLTKLEQYQKTHKLVTDLSKDIKFEEGISLAKAAGAENLSFRKPDYSASEAVNHAKSLVTRNDMREMHAHLEVMHEIDPANPKITSLLDRISHQDVINWKEVTDTFKSFSEASQGYYLTKLQDEINNERVNAQLHGEPVPETVAESVPAEEPSNIINFPRTEKADEPAHPSEPQAPHTPETPHIELPHLQIPHISQKPPIFTRQTEAKLNKVKESFNKVKSQPAPPQLSERLSPRLNSANRIMRVRPTSITPINSRTRRRKVPVLKRVAPRALGASALGGGSAASSGFLSNLLGARSVMQLAQATIGRLFPSVGRLIGNLMPEKLLAQGLRGLWNIGSSLGRAAFDGLIKNAFNLAPRGLGLGGIGGGGFFSGAAATAGAILTSAAFWWIIGTIGLFVLFFWYDNMMGNSQCDKPGQMEVKKVLENPRSGVDNVKNGDQIDYQIQITYIWLCNEKNLPSVTITDTVPNTLEYVPGSAKSESAFGVGPEGFYDENSRIITWTLTNVSSNDPYGVSFSVKPIQQADGSWSVQDTWLQNQATVSFKDVQAPTTSSGGGGVINVQSPSLEGVINQAAQNVGMEPALMKAFLRVEAPKTLEYSEQEFQFFSTPGWWEGRVADAPGRDPSNNDPQIVRGYGYNTCAYRNCAPGSDVRGVTQFELKTWNGIANQLQFSDGHTPDRRNATDAIFGSALLNKQNAQYYTGSPNFEWTEEVIRAAGRIYCGGPSYARRKLTDGACVSSTGRQYEDLLWDFYQEYLGR